MNPPRPRKPQKRSTAHRRPATGRDFWGTDDADEEVAEPIRPTDDPAAMIKSLGPAPVPGHETAAEKYFEVVYEKAVAAAVALAAANGLLETVPDDDEVMTRGKPRV